MLSPARTPTVSEPGHRCSFDGSLSARFVTSLTVAASFDSGVMNNLWWHVAERSSIGAHEEYFRLL
jgi:hypothetical protein